MPSFAALFTSDPFLVRCELHRVREQFSLGGPSDVVGVGAYEDSVVLLKRYGSGIPRTDLWDAPETDSGIKLRNAWLNPATCVGSSWKL